MSISSVGRAAERRGPSPRMLLRLVLKDARDAIHCSAHRGCCPPPSTSISSATGVGFLQSCIYTFRAALSKPAIQHLRNQILERGCVDADLVLPHGAVAAPPPPADSDMEKDMESWERCIRWSRTRTSTCMQRSVMLACFRMLWPHTRACSLTRPLSAHSTRRPR